MSVTFTVIAMDCKSSNPKSVDCAEEIDYVTTQTELFRHQVFRFAICYIVLINSNRDILILSVVFKAVSLNILINLENTSMVRVAVHLPRPMIHHDKNPFLSPFLILLRCNTPRTNVKRRLALIEQLIFSSLLLMGYLLSVIIEWIIRTQLICRCESRGNTN